MKRGDKIGRYVLGDQIGEGAMALVFASRHPVLDRQVAVKVLKREACHDAHYVARFLEDARSAHGLDHPNIVRVYDVDEAEGRPFIVMELVEGPSLDAWMAGRKVEVREAVRIARDLAGALSVAHADGLVHRDVKPSNILIDAASGTAKLTDFGAAKRDRPGEQQLTVVGQRIGTPRYMAPEQVEGAAVDARTDLFAVGATLYELLAGRPAFEASSVSAAFHAILFATPPPLAELRPDAPAELRDLVDRLLAKAPEARPSSAAEVAAVLDGLLEVDATAAGAQPSAAAPAEPVLQGPASGSEETGPAAGSEKTSPAKRGTMLRSRLVPAAAGVALLIVLGVGGWWWLSPTPEPDVTVAAEAEGGAESPAEAAGAPEPEADAETAAAEQPDGGSEPQATEQVALSEPQQEDVTPEPDVEVVAEPQVTETAPRWEDEAEEPDVVEVTPRREDEPAGPDATGGSLEPEPAIAEAQPRWEPDQEESADAPEAETAAATASPRWEEEPGEAPAEPVTSEEELTAQLAPGVGAAPAESGAKAGPEVQLDIPDCPSDGVAPGCALAAEALRTMVATPAPAPAVNLNQPDGVYLDQDYLVVEMKLPEDIGGYVYVDVLTDAGSVYHLLPEPLRADNQLQPGGVMRVGVEAEERRDGVRHWQVSAPFGDAYLLVLVSEKPVYEDLRPIAEPLESYRDVLLEALADPATGAKSVHLRRIEFRPR